MKSCETKKNYLTNSGHLLYIGNYTAGYIPSEELELLEKIKYNPRSLPLYELAMVFPESKTVLKKLIKEDSAKIDELSENKRKIQNYINSKIRNPQEAEMAFEFYSELLVEIPKRKIEKKLNRNKKILSFIQYKGALGGGENLSLNIEQAKNVPISDYIEFNRAGFAPCIWHNEKSPSMFWYKNQNRVKCFGCGQIGDIIDVIQHLHKVEFLQAVRIILGK